MNNLSFLNTRAFPCAAVLLATAVGLGASEKIDLSRTQPVPANEQIPIMDFFRPPSMAYPVLNRAGTHFAAFISAGRDQLDMLIYNLETNKGETLLTTGDRDVEGIEWLGDDTLMFMQSHEKYYVDGLLAVNINKLDRCYPVLQNAVAIPVGVPDRNRYHPLVWIAAESGDPLDRGVAELNSQLIKGDLHGSDWQESNMQHIAKRYPIPQGGIVDGYMADKDGELAFATTNKDGVETLHRLVGDHWEKCPVDLDQIGIIACGNKPGELVVLGPRGGGKPRALQFMDAATGQLGDVLIQDKDHDFTGWLYRHPVTHVIIGAVYQRSGPQVMWFTETYQKIQKILDGSFPGLVVRIIGSDLAERRFLVDVFSDRQPPKYLAVDLEKHAISPIKTTVPWIDPARMQPMNIMKVKTRDGLILDAYVTLPKGTSKQHPAPLVVLSHGGPHARDEWGFNPEVQLLASRGYAVLQTNYRGSPGSGWMYPIEDEWAFRKMHDDVTDATKAVLATGLVDPKRVGIMGTSFGAYLAVSGAAFEPNLYRCAVAIAGIYDWAAVIQDAKYNQFDGTRYVTEKRWLGDPNKEKEKFDWISPQRHVEQIKIPVFVSHGKDDLVADIAESRRLVSALDKYNVPHEVYFPEGEGHGMQHLSKQVELYSRIEAFLAKNLSPVAPVQITEAP